jgi:pimeloyl-ACP methyl ester carboxylesterase
MNASKIEGVLGGVALLWAASCGLDTTASPPSGVPEVGAAESALLTAAPASGFVGGFSPRAVPYGGFGGGPCRAVRTPVVFFPGNGDEARNLDFPASTGAPSVYKALRAGGYQECEIFGLDYLSAEQRLAPLRNYHDRAKAKMAADFIRDVLAYTGQPKVDLIGHSLGATLALQALDIDGLWPSVRRFIAISGGMRGLDSCLTVGPANPLILACASQNLLDHDVFGLYPDTFFAPNPNLGFFGYAVAPARARDVRFYSISAGFNDGFICETTAFTANCTATARFAPFSNVVAQVDVGRGSTALSVDYRLDDYSIFTAGAGDIDGVGHFRAKNNTGSVQLNMLTTDCQGADCCTGYGDVCR